MKKTWTKSDVKLPFGMYRFCAVITKGDQYVILLGNDLDKRILILDLRTMEFTQSKVELPRSCCKAIVIENKNENNLLVHGFIRQEIINRYNMHIPLSLIGSVGQFHCIEYIHILYYRGGDNHYKINVDNVLQNRHEKIQDFKY